MTGEFLVADAIVEIPRGSRNKYEFDPNSESIRLDRVLYSSVHYPGDYGFIVGTRCGDGDPLDVLILVEEPTFPGCRIRVRPIGVLLMEDEGGEDEKILGVPSAILDSPRYSISRTYRTIGWLRSRTSSRPTKFWKVRRPRRAGGKVPRMPAWSWRDDGAAKESRANLSFRSFNQNDGVRRNCASR